MFQAVAFNNLDSNAVNEDECVILKLASVCPVLLFGSERASMSILCCPKARSEACLTFSAFVKANAKSTEVSGHTVACRMVRKSQELIIDIAEGSGEPARL